MANLIIVIVSIVLVAALAIAGIFYGGQAMTDGKIESQTSQAMNESSQIRSAMRMWEIDNPNGSLADFNDLVPKYLNYIPPGWTQSGIAADGSIILENTTMSGNEEICMRVNARLNLPYPPPVCDDTSIGCCDPS